MSEEMSIYAKYADKEESAIQAARVIYLAKYPMPEKPKIQSNIWKFIAGFSILLIAATIVSGAHTIPLFQLSIAEYKVFGAISLKKIVGVSAFTMIEAGMVMLAISRIVHYTSTQRETWEHNNKQVSRFILVSLGLIFGVALFANIYSTLTLSVEHDQESAVDNVSSQAQASEITMVSNPVNTQNVTVQEKSTLATVASVLLFTLMGASAPVLTLLSGEVIGKVLVSENAKKELKLQKWEKDKDTWNEAFLEDYKNKKGRGIWKVEVDEPVKQDVLLLNRPEKVVSNALVPIKVKIDDKIKYECPACHKVITRQAWVNHKCRFDD